MLSESDRKTLSEIERALSDEDPKLAEKLKRAEWPAVRERGRPVYAALIVIAALLSVVALGLGHMTGAIACGLVAGWTWAAWQRRIRPGLDRSRVPD